LVRLSAWKNHIIKKVQAGEVQGAITFAKEFASRGVPHNEIADFLNDIGIIVGKERERHDEALLVFEAAIHLAKDDTIKSKASANCAVAHSILGNMFGRNGKFTESEFHFKEALRLNPNLPIAHSEYAYLLNLLKRYDEAETHFKEALRLEPRNATTHINYAILLDRLDRLYDALLHCEEALRLDPTNPVYHAAYGTALMKCKRLNEAEQHFQEALRIDPNLSFANYGYGKLLTNFKRFTEAKNYFKKTLELDPTNADASISYEYAVLMEVSGNPRKKITKEWLDMRKRCLERERQNDLKDFKLQEKHRKEWEKLYDNFECMRCGRCCKRTKWVTNIDTRLVWEDVERWRKEDRIDILKYVQVFEDLGGDLFDKETYRKFSKCPFLKKEGKAYTCTIHQTKPWACKVFPFYFNYQGICENCGSSIKKEDVFCEKCGFFLKAHPAANSCSGMRKTLKLLGLYREVYPPTLDLIGLAFRKN